MKITFLNTEIEPKCKMREFLIYEQLNNGLIFTGEDAEEYVKLFYASIINALGYQPAVDDFLEFVEKNEDALVEFIKENFENN